MSDTKQQQIEAEASQAQALMDNPLLMAILAELDADAVRTWRNGANPEQREQAWHQMGAIQQLAHRIKGRLDTKKLAGRGHRRNG